MPELLVKLQIYEGPLDLLLHLIKKNEVDIQDIPVALITAQYLEYLEIMEALNVELAGDFLLMAATLTQIKSRLLLPDLNEADQEEAAGEIRAALVDPLLEHLRFKGFKDAGEAALVLSGRSVLGSDVFVRGQAAAEAAAPPGEVLVEATLFDLVEAFRRLAEGKKADGALRFVVESKTLAQRLVEIQHFLKTRKSGSFTELCRDDRDQGALVLSFLAVLELARVGFMRFYQNLRKSSELRMFLVNPEADLSGLADLTY